MVRTVQHLALLALLTAPARMLASEDEVVRRWEFKTDGDVAGWTAGGDAQNLMAAKDVLRFTMAGPDAYVFAPAVDVPLDGCLIRVRMRCDRPGDCQVYWTCADAPEFSERQVLSVAAPAKSDPERGFTTWEFPIGRTADHGRRLTRFRIDPFNGNTGSTVEIAAVELVRQAARLDANFALAAHWVEVGQPVAARVTLRHMGGRVPEGRYGVTFSDGRRTEVTPSVPTPYSPPLPRGEERQGTRGGEQSTPSDIEFKFDRPGVHHVRAAIAEPDGKALYDLETSILVGEGERLPIATSIESERVRLDLIPTADSELVGAARWMAKDAVGEWKLAGWLLPLVQMAVERSDGVVIRRHPGLHIDSDANVGTELAGTMQEAGQNLKITLLAIMLSNPPQVLIDTTLSAAQSLRLVDFSAPVVLADRASAGEPLERFAMFGGLEFLEPGWASSSDRAVGERFAQRWSPAPHKITLPVMAVEAQGLTTAVMWKPGPAAAGPAGLPTATFASPNLLDGQSNHLMKLSLPGVPDWRQENEGVARKPFPLDDRPLAMSCTLHAEAGLPLAMVARRWYETFKVPPPPDRPHDDQATYNLIARNYGETMWWADAKGWRHHWYLDERTAYIPDIAAELIAHSVATGNQQWVERTGLQGQQIIDAAGTLTQRLMDDRYAKHLLTTMRPDGTWAFKNTPELRERVRQFTQSQYDSLGEDGSTSLGTCVQAALPILRYAELSGDAKCTEAGLKALESMRRFRVPRGAQVWEVHQDIPDIRAAALAVEAYQLGFRITGDRKYLEDATYWAWTGVPFVFSWEVPVNRAEGGIIAAREREAARRVHMPLSEGFEQPQRNIIPYATIPVMGPTFYVINWFGVVVQWCGLEWAEKVITLDADAPDPLLRYIADGVVNSGFQQMFDRPPWVGLYPDVWDIEHNLAQGAFIYATLPLRCLKAQGRAPLLATTWTRVLQTATGGPPWHVSGWGTPPEQIPPPNHVTWSVRLAYPAGQANELLIVGAPKPKRVRIEDVMLEERAGENAAPATADTAVAHTTAGWRYVGEKKAISIRIISPPAGEATVRIEW